MRLRFWFAAFDALSWLGRRVHSDALERAQYFALQRAGAAIDWERSR